MKSAAFQKFNLANDMLETVNIVRNFDCNRVAPMAEKGKATGKLFFVGEGDRYHRCSLKKPISFLIVYVRIGSSRIFPSKHCMKVALQRGYRTVRHTEGGVQAQSYDLKSWTVFGVSNSGRTAEVIGVFRKLKEAHHASGLYSLTAFPDTYVTVLVFF
jgi:glucosamine--fructose-6-phosphate aminotransferase (isomerizing)